MRRSPGSAFRPSRCGVDAAPSCRSRTARTHDCAMTPDTKRPPVHDRRPLLTAGLGQVTDSVCATCGNTPAPRCRRCGQPATNRLGRDHLCAYHYAAWVTPLRRKWGDGWQPDPIDFPLGVGVIDAALWGHPLGWVQLRCDIPNCPGTWYGLPDAPLCPWCWARFLRWKDDGAL